MIRWIDMQWADKYEFAWFDTEMGTFVDLKGYQTWPSWEKFEIAYVDNGGWLGRPLQRFRDAYPFTKDPTVCPPGAETEPVKGYRVHNDIVFFGEHGVWQVAKAQHPWQLVNNSGILYKFCTTTGKTWVLNSYKWSEIQE